MILWILLYSAVLLREVGGQLDTFYFNVMPHDQDVIEGNETRIRCDVSDRRHVFFQWTMDGKPVVNTTRRFQEDSNLRILRVLRSHDAGLFQCTATNATTRFSLQSSEARLNIQCGKSGGTAPDRGTFNPPLTGPGHGHSGPVHNALPASLRNASLKDKQCPLSYTNGYLISAWIEKRADVELKRPRLEEVKKGVDVILKCVTAGNPPPTILWYHNKFRLFTQERVKILDEGNRIKLLNRTLTDNGIYSCRAENVAGAVDSTNNFLLNVKVDGFPQLQEDQFTPYLVALRGEPALFDCRFVGASEIYWFSNFAKLSNNTRHILYPNGSLYFPKVRSADEGSYRCEGLHIRRNDSKPDGHQTFLAELALASLDEIKRDSFEPRLIPNYPVVIPVHERFEIKVFPPRGRPKPNFWWVGRNGLPVPSTGRIYMQDTSLVFASPQEIDSGNYTFVLNNTAAVKRMSVWVMVSVPPIISRAPQPATVEEDGEVILSCQVVGTQYPVTRVTWTRDGADVPVSLGRFQQDLQNGVLRIMGAQLSDMGDYACVANTSGHLLVSSATARLTVTKRLKFSPTPSDAQLELDKVGEIECKAEAETQPHVRWLKVGSGKLQRLPDHVYQRGNRLVFDTARRQDAGSYMCVASHTTQGIINATIYVHIVEWPAITVKSNNVTVFEGQPALLHCVAKGSPSPHISWYRDSQPILPDAKRYTIFKNGSMNIRQVFIEDNGMYACVANNTAGVARWDFYLRVTNHPLDEEEDFNMVKTIIIAVCSAGAYLALVIGLTAFCSYRLLMQCRNHKALPLKTENGDLHREQHELLMKDRDSCAQFRSDSDNRSHAGSALSSQPGSHSSQSQNSRSRRPSLDRLQYPRHQLNTLGIMGKGCFGDVFLARTKGPRPGDQEILVVVKSLLTKGEREVRDFYAEMDMFARVEHPNVVHLVGVCREAEPHFLITEYCDWGDLKQFLLATRSDNGRRGTRVPALTLTQKLSMGQQVAAGMDALASQGLVHGDLAARNILLTSRMQLKVARPSLCGDVYASEYYPLHKRLVPLRWMAPEAVGEEEGGVMCTTAGDIWAYGVFLWEVMQLADLPYRLLSDEEVLRALQHGQASLELSELYSPTVMNLLQRCTAQLPSQRPAFSEISTILSLAGSDVV